MTTSRSCPTSAAESKAHAAHDVSVPVHVQMAVDGFAAVVLRVEDWPIAVAAIAAALLVAACVAGARARRARRSGLEPILLRERLGILAGRLPRVAAGIARPQPWARARLRVARVRPASGAVALRAADTRHRWFQLIVGPFQSWKYRRRERLSAARQETSERRPWTALILSAVSVVAVVSLVVLFVLER